MHHSTHTQQPPKSAFALVLVLMLLSIIGGAVLWGQVLTQQRLYTATNRNRSFRRQVASEAAVQLALNHGLMSGHEPGQTVVDVPLSEVDSIAVEWEPLPYAPDTPSNAILARTKMIETGNQNGATAEYLAWPVNNRWHLTRRREDTP